MSSVTVFVGIGSNLEQPQEQVRRAVRALAELPQSVQLSCSPWYRSEPLGPPGQPDYINGVVGLETTLGPNVLLQTLQAIEQAQGRVRELRWGPRTLDLDLLLYGDLIQEDSWLTLPHPRMHERAFVLYPLYDIAPDLKIPGFGRLERLIKTCPALGLRRLPII